MHYIVGTSFRVAPNSKVNIRDKRFVPNQSYVLTYISRKQDKVIYFFSGGGQKFQIEFNSCREGDALISKFRNENIPNYEERVEEVVDVLND